MIAVQFVSDDPTLAGTMLMRWVLQPQGDGQILIRIEACEVPVGVAPEDHALGLAQSLETPSAWCDRPH